MSDDLDPLDDRPAEGDPGRPPFASRRFARLVQSPAARRVSPRRLAGACLIAGSLAWGAFEVGTRLARSVVAWIAAQPEHQVPFDAIELVPPPPPYIKEGTAGILAAVRHEARYDATLPVLATDLEALRVAVSRNPWIAAAGPVRAGYRHLAVGVRYRKPVATILFDAATGQSVVIDRDGVELPVGPGEIEWAETRPRYRLAGDPYPLIEIKGLGPAQGGRVGLVWRSTDPKIEADKVIQAARLAEFLADRAATTPPAPGRALAYPEIHNHPRENIRDALTRKPREVSGFYLLDASRNFIFWNSAPGFEAKGEAGAARKWDTLARHLGAHGMAKLDQAREYLSIEGDQVVVRQFRVDAAAHQARPGNSTRR